MTSYHIVRSLEVDRVRLSDYVHLAFSHIASKKTGQRYIKLQLVMLNDKLGYSGDWVHVGDKISLSSPKSTTTPTTSMSPPHIYYEDDHVCVVHKPAGLNVSGNRFSLMNHLQAIPSSGDIYALPYPYPAHRLDRDTAGLLLCAKDHATLVDLQEQFANHTIHKQYWAISTGKLPDHEGAIDQPIDGLEAQTHYKVIQYKDSYFFGSLSLVALTPITGRTHQIRKHLASINCPILGDKIYNLQAPNIGKGMFLFALSIGFTHPKTLEHIQVSMDPPAKIDRVLSYYGRQANIKR